MCGIIGYCGEEQALPFLIDGLRRLEYRGYDSAGIGLVNHQTGQITVVKEQGKVAQGLFPRLGTLALPESSVGIAHTRWATHGAPSQRNSHPHISCHGTVAVAHNGIVENFQFLKQLLEEEGHVFVSETDTEVIAHLIEASISKGLDLAGAVRELVVGQRHIEGAYGIVVISGMEPGRLVAVCDGSPLVIGIGDHGTFVASDLVGFLAHTKRKREMANGEMAIFNSDGTYDVRTVRTNDAAPGDIETIDWDLEQISKGGYPHFMLREIMEQPKTLQDTLRGRLSDGSCSTVHLGGVTDDLKNFIEKEMDEVVLTACGTSLHAGMIGERIFEKLLKLNVRTRCASELATGHMPMGRRTLLIAISQSGETKDTVEAARYARNHGATVWSICNRVSTRLTRVGHTGMYLHVGPEIGVASTKAFTSQVVALVLTALKFVEIRRPADVGPDAVQHIITALRALPDQAAEVTADAEHVQGIAQQFAKSSNALFLGRGYNLATALEGALKLKEISYIHAEGYPAGEMKHGPIALIDKNMPVVVIMPQEGEDESTYLKVISNVEEVASRDGQVIVVASRGDPLPERMRQEGKVRRILYVPHTIAMLTPVLASIYLQLLAYHIAVIRGCDVDQPRNLAKSVTVE